VEVRTTAPGSLQGLPLWADAPLVDRRFEAVLTVVSGAPEARGLRRLPTLYLGRAPLFADRDLSRVLDRLMHTIDTMKLSISTPVYALNACRVEGRYGLYGADVFNRSVRRRRLQRLGMDFAQDPYVRLTSRGTFECESWGEFAPGFVITSVSSSDPQYVLTTSSAWTLAIISNARFGGMTVSELRELATAFASIKGYGSPDARRLMESLRAAMLSAVEDVPGE
jgi:hypothetical protein